MKQTCVLIMAGGTGGHIFPALAVAVALREQGCVVHWLGTPGSMECERVPAAGFAVHTVDFGGLRGKGLKTLLTAPWRLLRATRQALSVMSRCKPDLVLGFGGYVTVPGGLAAWLRRTPLLLHEQNAIAGMSNRLLARLARQVYTAFPNVLTQQAGQWIGNPLRQAFLQQRPPMKRYAERKQSGERLHLLVVGGSLGAQALNQCVPEALALLPESARPTVTHQSGQRHLAALQQNYQSAGVTANCVDFIDDTASAFAAADVVIARAGASTVTELAAVGCAALFVPYPHAVDDHQTANAQFLVRADAAWLQAQSTLTARGLADWLQSLTRADLQVRAERAWQLRKTDAVECMVMACLALLPASTRAQNPTPNETQNLGQRST